MKEILWIQSQLITKTAYNDRIETDKDKHFSIKHSSLVLGSPLKPALHAKLKGTSPRQEEVQVRRVVNILAHLAVNFFYWWRISSFLLFSGLKTRFIYLLTIYLLHLYLQIPIFTYCWVLLYMQCFTCTAYSFFASLLLCFPQNYFFIPS